MGAIGAGAATAADVEGATGATGEQEETGRKAGQAGGGEDEQTGESAGITTGEGERGPNGTDGDTAPHMTTSPSMRATGDETKSPDNWRLTGEGLAEVGAAASETGGQGASTIFWVNARETAAAERVGLEVEAEATETGVPATDPEPASRGGDESLLRTLTWPRKDTAARRIEARRPLRVSESASRRRRRLRRMSRPWRAKAGGIYTELAREYQNERENTYRVARRLLFATANTLLQPQFVKKTNC